MCYNSPCSVIKYCVIDIDAYIILNASSLSLFMLKTVCMYVYIFFMHLNTFMLSHVKLSLSALGMKPYILNLYNIFKDKKYALFSQRDKSHCYTQDNRLPSIKHYDGASFFIDPSISASL